MIEPSSNNSQQNQIIGVDGYDNMESDMRAIFLANGPLFNKNILLPWISNLSLYPLMAHILGISPADNNGTLLPDNIFLQTSNTEHLLK